MKIKKLTSDEIAKELKEHKDILIKYGVKKLVFLVLLPEVNRKQIAI